MSLLTIPDPGERKYLPAEYRLSVWSKLKPYYGELLRRKIDSVADLEQWIRDWTEANFHVLEELDKYNTNKSDEDPDRYNYILHCILPKVEEKDYELRLKLVDSPFIGELKKNPFRTILKSSRSQIKKKQISPI